MYLNDQPDFSSNPKEFNFSDMSKLSVSREFRLNQYAIDNSPVATLRVDQSGQFIYSNHAIVSLTGYSQTELCRMKVWDLDIDFSPERFADLWNNIQKNVQNILTSHLKLKDGRILTVEVNVNLQKIENDQYLFVYIADIGNRLKAEEDLQETQRKLEAIHDNLFQLTGLLDLDGHIVMVNKTALDMIGKEESDIIGRKFWEAEWWSFSKDIQRQLKNAIKQAGEGELIRFETVHPNKDGEYRYIDFSLRPVRNAQGEICYLLPEGFDITERKKNESALLEYHNRMEELVQERTNELEKEIEVRKQTEIELSLAMETAETANLAKSTFLANMSHDLRTPLNGILGYSQILQRDTGLTDIQKDRLSRIRQNGNHLLALINQVLEMAKIESGYSALQEAGIAPMRSYLGGKSLLKKGVYPVKTKAGKDSQHHLTRELIAQIPDNLLKQLRNYSLELNQPAMKQLINKIYQLGYLNVAENLQLLVDDFKFEDIIDLLDQ